MPIRKTNKGWYWGKRGPFRTKEQAENVQKAAYAGGYKGTENQIKKRKKK